MTNQRIRNAALLLMVGVLTMAANKMISQYTNNPTPPGTRQVLLDDGAGNYDQSTISQILFGATNQATGSGALVRSNTPTLNAATFTGTNVVSTLNATTLTCASVAGQIPTGSVTNENGSPVAYQTNTVKTLGITIDGGGSTITSGTKGYLEVPCDCTVLSATILADQAGSVAIETWRTNAASFPPTRAGALFTNYLASAQSSTDTTLSGITSRALAKQDRLGFTVTTNALLCTRITLQVRVQP